MLQSLRRVFRYYREYRRSLIVSQVLLLVSASSTIALATFTQRLIDDGIAQGNAQVVNSTGIWMMVFAVVAGLAMGGAAFIAVMFAQAAAYWLRTEAYASIQKFSFENFDRFRTGGLLVNLSSDVANVANAVMFTILFLLQSPFMILVVIALTLINTPSLVWLLLLLIVLVLAVMAWVLPRILKAYNERQARLDDVNNTLQESLSGVRVVKAFAREDYEVSRFETAARKLQKTAFRAAFIVAFLGPVLTASAMIVTTATLGVGGDRVFAGTLQVGQLVAFNQYLALVIAPLAILGIAVPMLLRGDTSAERIYDVIDAEPTIADAADVVPHVADSVRGEIEFENVSFAFHGPDGTVGPPVLKEVNLKIEAGSRVGILGATGSGKTALVNLISRFYEPTGGRVTLDGIDVQQYPVDQLHQMVGVALQEALLFQGDVRFNLKFGAPDASDDVMRGATQAADAYGFVTNLPEQWEAPVARRGNNFSGGQRQRLSMARALTTVPRVLILDDSTSALDAATEARVQAAIPGFADNITTIYVAQRISAVIDLDQIILLQDGQILAVGNHEELLESNALYQEIYASQLGDDVVAGLDLEDV